MIKRKDVNMSTFKRVKDFLKKQKKPVYKTELVKLGINNDSLNFVLKMLKIKTDKEGKISLK